MSDGIWHASYGKQLTAGNSSCGPADSLIFFGTPMDPFRGLSPQVRKSANKKQEEQRFPWTKPQAPKPVTDKTHPARGLCPGFLGPSPKPHIHQEECVLRRRGFTCSTPSRSMSTPGPSAREPGARWVGGSGSVCPRGRGFPLV